MRLGIYAGPTNPTVGGAHTLLETIRKDVASSHCEHERVFFFSDPDSGPETRIEGIRHVNLSKQAKLVPATRVKRKMAWLLRKPFRSDAFDALLKSEKIDLLWMLGPYDLDVSIPYIFTVWDLAHRVKPCFPEVSRDGWTWEAREMTYQKMLYKASYVVTGNEEGRREILKTIL